MAELPTTVDTAAGPLTMGATYNLTLKFGTIERELLGVTVVCFEHTDIGVPGGGKKPGDIVPSEVEIRLRAEKDGDEMVGFLPDDVLKAEQA